MASYEKKTGTPLAYEDVFADLKDYKSSDAVLVVLAKQAAKFSAFREDSKWGRLRGVLTPVVHVVEAFCETAGEGLSLVRKDDIMELSLSYILSRCIRSGRRCSQESEFFSKCVSTLVYRLQSVYGGECN